MRRPVDGTRVTCFLAESPEGLTNLINANIKPDQIISIKHEVRQYAQFGGHVARVHYREK